MGLHFAEERIDDWEYFRDTFVDVFQLDVSILISDKHADGIKNWTAGGE
jgi:hypothetical protein